MEEKSNLQKQAQDILLSQMRRGKTRTAQVIDGVLGILLLFGIFYSAAYWVTKQRLISLILSGLITTLILSLIRMISLNRRRRYIRQRLIALESEVRSQKLFFASQEALYASLIPFLEEMDVYLQGDRKTAIWKGQKLPFSVLYVIPDQKVELRDLIPLRQKDGIVFVTGNCSTSVRDFAKKLGFSLVLDPSEGDIAKHIPITQEEIYQYILEHAPKKKRQHIAGSMIFSPTHIKRYLSCGVFLWISSMFMLYPLYYRISACVMFALGMGCIAGRQRQET